MDVAYASTDDAEAVADDAEQRIYEVARREDRDEMAVLRDLVDQAMLDLESIQTRESAYTGLPTGFIDIDNLTSGLQPGNLIVLAARPGIGKSSLAINMARNIAVGRQPVAIFSLEMSRWEIGMRLLCAEARVPWDRIRNKRVGPNDWQAVVQAAEVLHDAPLSIVDSGNTNIVDIRAKARRMRTGKRGLSLIIVDYLQLMGQPGMGAPARLPPAGGRRDQPDPQDARQGARGPGDRASASSTATPRRAPTSARSSPTSASRARSSRTPTS